MAAANDVVGQPVEVQTTGAAPRPSVSPAKQVTALLQKNLSVHCRVNACPCFTCCGPGRCIPCVIFNPALLHFCCPIFFVLAITLAPWAIVQAVMDNPKDFLDVTYEKGNVVKRWPGIPVGNAAGAVYQVDRDASKPYSGLLSDSWQRASGFEGGMTLPAAHHLFAPKSRSSWSFEARKCVHFPVSCHCQTLALVGPDAAVDAFKAYLEAEYASFTSNILANETQLIRDRRTLMGFSNMGPSAPPASGGGRRLRDRLRDIPGDVADFLAEAGVSEAPAWVMHAIARRLAATPEYTDYDVESNASTSGSGRGDCDPYAVVREERYCNVDAGRSGPIFRKFASTDDVDKWVDGDYYGYYHKDRSETSDIDRLCGAVIFENDVRTDAAPTYTLRFNATDASAEMDVSGSLTSKSVEFGENRDINIRWYYTSGFLALQNYVQKFVGAQRGAPANSKINDDPTFFPMPTPGVETWLFGEVAGLFLTNPFTVSLMFGAIPASIAFYISRERQTRQREQMRMMGLSDTALMWSWVIMFVAFNFFITFFMCILFKVFLLKKTDFFLFWMALWWFANACVSFGMAVAAFVSNDKMAAMCAFGALFASTFIYIGIQEYDTLSIKMLVSLIPSVAFIQITTTSWEWERLNIGLGANNVNTDIKNFNVGGGIFMLFIDFWIYLAIYYYVDSVATWHGVGVARKPWFLCMGSFWREVMGEPPVIEGLTGKEEEAVTTGQHMESEDDEHLKSLVVNNKCVLIRGLHKTFRDAAGNSMTAVNNLSLTMYQDECFCLLGHNGAGKTTTMMMLTGCLPQSAGTIKVRGSMVPEQLRSVRSDMGFCPQHNVLVDELTVFEHLLLFGKIGGMARGELVKRGEELLTAVALMDKIHTRSSALSGGMKRKLSCALAFLSNPYLVILDEPSSGMDPFARRGMWDTLKQWRSGHILCLTTHYMDEADALGDRIAIMSDGRLACSGSSAFLKREFGCGYVISFAKTDSRQSQDSEILHAVRGSVGVKAEVVSSIGKELLIQVPFDAVDKFPALFAAVDQNKDKLGIEAYGTSVTNLEEVFIKVAEISRAHKKGGKQEDLGDAEVLIQVKPADEKSVGAFCQRFMIQLFALTIRRFRHAYRNRMSCCAQVGMPVSCLFIFFLIIAATTVSALPKLVLDTTKWNDAISSGVKVPMTVGAIQGDASMDAMMSLWASMPGADGVRPERVPASSDPALFGGMVEESDFVQRVLVNKDLQEASQFGAVFYPSKSSWCPASSSVCTEPGPTIVCNTTAIHAAPVLLSMHARAALGGSVNFELTNHPFQKTRQQRDNEEFVSGILASIVIMAAYGFVPAGATSYVVMEKEKDVKHQLEISGCNMCAYWLSNFIFDILWGLIPVVGAWITFLIFDIDSFVGYPGMNASAALFLAFLPAMAGFAYVFSFAFSRAGVALFVSWIFNLSFGFVATMLIWVLSRIDSLYNTALVLQKIFRFVPVYDLGYGHLRASIYQRDAEEYGYGPLSGIGTGGEVCPPQDEWKGRKAAQVCRYMVGDEFQMLIICGFLWLTVTIIIDVLFKMPIVKKALCRAQKSPAWLASSTALAGGAVEDDLVTAEKERVKTLDGTKQFVYVNGIHKVYGTGGKTHAVRGVSFAADEGQVFGLLGVNGAGKTTTFKMLCGQIEPTAGEVRIQGYDVTTNAAEARKHIGYCPQFDAQLESLTPREHLYLFGRLKGLHGFELTEAVRNQLSALDLDSYVNSRAGQLSGGNKRKLSVAMATIGEPPMVFLDEPSAGMDPVARRGMWAVIQSIADRRKKSVVILTTHSMDEAEALCSRIAIQVDGQFRCLGTAQQIKSRYGEGLELNARFTTPSYEEIAACCAQLQGSPQQVLEVNFARQKVSEVYGERVCGDLVARPGSPLAGGATTGMAVLAESILLVQRVQAFEAFLYTELSRDAADPSVPLCVVLEKSQNVARYQITSAALQGRFKSLGVLFNLFQEHKRTLLLSDFQICQTSLEQIFNRFATMQMSQQHNPRNRPTSPSQVAPEEKKAPAPNEVSVIGKGEKEYE